MAITAPPTRPAFDPTGIAHLRRVADPALVLAPPTFLDEVAARLAAAGIPDAVARHDPAPIYDLFVRLTAYSGISDSVAAGWDERHGGARWRDVRSALQNRPSCPRLRSYWGFTGCGYRRGTGTCAEPAHLARCPVPRLPLRKGALNQSAFALGLYVRDVCGGDIVGWLDARLASADPGRGTPERAAKLGAAVAEPLAAVTGIGPKLAAMLLAELLLAGDPGRERWVAAGAGMVVVDSLVHSWPHRSGALRRCGVEHPYGATCHTAHGCAGILRAVAATVDARRYNPAFPRVFPRFLAHALWRFCAADGLNQCNGNRIDDRHACRRQFCPAGPACDRVPLRPHAHP